MSVFSIFPARASSTAGEVDALYSFLLVVCIGMTALIFFCVFFFAVKYRRKHHDEPAPRAIHGSVPLEVFWSVTPFLVMMVMFFWSAALYYDYFTAPVDAMDIYITGKQWMWKVQYPEGQREINELHVPVGRAVKLTMASEDVIHSFFLPAFRIKQDVVPGLYRSQWFHATRTGTFPLYCAEYCGTFHSRMIGRVFVMAP